MNEPTLTPTPEEVVPVPVPTGSVPAVVLEMGPPARNLAADQLPTARVPSIAPPLPPPVPPQGPAHKTQPLRAVTREEAAARLASDKRRVRRLRWEQLVANGKRVVAVVAARFGASAGARPDPHEGSSERRLGFVCAATGIALIAGALVLGWQGVASERFDKVEQASLAVAIVFARAAIAIASKLVGYGLLRVGEPTLLAFPKGKGQRGEGWVASGEHPASRVG